MLEQLHIDSKGEAVLQGDWKLLFLKVLVYEHFRPDKGCLFYILFCFILKLFLIVNQYKQEISPE